ncbi:cytochrome P450 [Sinomonas cellulolyticus]|uniref:Cytochrome P450 n=1 Tax=Sinomonas cellulolyticus TaxID=2801916 RepID=A0ABS1K2H7_9MICC|nr:MULTISPECIES: cytochrome P450 [Sinomonas]MBL0705117.1 cytochrome P450 [Sinomonas cellulolyticus]GHG60816.1 cytochrome P450 [Sinomonas sp. KCTC 49339]
MKSRYPGVPYAPRLPFVGSLVHLRRARSDVLLDAADELGDVFGLDLGAEHVLVVGHPADAVRVLEERPDIYPDKGGPTGFRRSSIPFLGGGLSTWNGMDAEWRRRRSGMARAFRSHSPSSDISPGLAGATVDRVRSILESEIVADLATALLGRRPDQLEADKVALGLRRLAGTFWRGKMPGPHPVLARRTRRDVAELELIVQKWADIALATRNSPLVCHVGGLTEVQIRDEVLSQLLSAGTLAMPMVWGLDVLARHPEAQDRLREALAPRSQAVDYVIWTLREILRLCPSTYWVQRQASIDDELSGVQIRAGSRVIVHVPRVHRHPEYWAEPDVFRPERFSEGASWKRAWMPFGRGPRSCVARSYALDAITRVLGNVIRTHHIEPLGAPTRLVPAFSLIARPAPAFEIRPLDAS